MPLLSCHAIAKSFGARDIFSNISLTVDEDERLGLIGPNGAGKSTLLKIMAGLIEPDEGTVAYRKQLRLAYVPQTSEFTPGSTAFDIVAAVLEGEPLDEVERSQRVSVALGRVGFVDLQANVDTLSGGWKKRLSIARELAREPDLLLLDEPTNHLDLEGILWLEKLLENAPFASVIVSHDRYFLDNVVSGMAEISTMYPDGLFRVGGSYTEFLEKKAAFLDAQAKQQDALQIQVRKEVEWLRRRPKARTTKSKARIDEAGRLKTELAEVSARNAPQKAAGIEFNSSDRQTKRLVTVKEVSKAFGTRKLFDKLSFTLTPGTRLGIAGRNGTGKTTILRMVRGTETPDSGSIQLADMLQVVYFDQNREHLDPQLTLRRALCPDGDSVLFQGRPIHVNSWAKRFLFRTEQLELPLHRLSGGEQARVLIARLMLQPADLLLLDEPTNDLDISTLEVLEDNLIDFPGAVLLVTHDRFMLDRVSTSVLALDGDGLATIYAEYRQWEQTLLTKKPATVEKAAPVKAVQPAAPAPPGKKKLSYMEAREWEQMEEKIHEAERVLQQQQKLMDDPAVNSDPSRVQQVYAALHAAQAQVEQLYERWAELEAKQA